MRPGDELQVQGNSNKAEGAAGKAAGDVKDAARDATDLDLTTMSSNEGEFAGAFRPAVRMTV